jgi:murein DD-endopeptidase MepM/ murein hydrolase activator NlpD
MPAQKFLPVRRLASADIMAFSRIFAFGLPLAAGFSCNANPAPPAQQQAKAAAVTVAQVATANVVTQPNPPAKLTNFWLSQPAAQGAMIVGRVPDGTASVQLDGQAVAVDNQGYFVIGFDRDAPAAAKLTAQLKNGGKIELPLTIAQTKWSISYVNTPYFGGAADEADFKAKRDAELAQIAEARNTRSNSQGWRQKFTWPFAYWTIKGGRISGLFGRQRYYQGKPGSPHGGLDIAAPTGTPFYAPADGVVVLAAKTQPFTLEGHLLIIDHGNGVNSAFLHCSQLLVEKGQVVKQGQLIGKVGNTGRSAGAHLHWGMKWNAARVDPLRLVPKK